MSPTVQPTGLVTSPAEMSALFREIRQDAKAERDELETKSKAERDELEAKIKAEHKAEMDQMRADIEKLKPAPPQELISAEQLAALQARLESLHAAQLLTDEEYFALEDLCADYLEVQTFAAGVLTQEVVGSNPAYGEVAKLAQLIAVSEGLASDAGFARQARRKFV